MATQAQIEANRENAQKSTGPRTAEGKAVSSKNAVKYGLFAKETVISGENQAEYDAFYDAALAELAPSGAMEAILAERIVSLSWRLRRAVRFQNEVIDVMIDDEELKMIEEKDRVSLMSKQWQEFEASKRKPDPGLILGRVIKRDFSYKIVTERLSLYERRIENSLFRTINEFEKHKLLRQKEEHRIQNTGDRRQVLSEAEGTEDNRPQIQDTGDRTAEDRLKKRTQSVEKQDLTSYEKRDYEDAIRPEQNENEAGLSRNATLQTKQGRDRG